MLRRVDAPDAFGGAQQCVVSATSNPAISGSTFLAASAKLSLKAPAKATKRSAAGVNDRAVKPTRSSHGNTPLPQRPQ